MIEKYLQNVGNFVSQDMELIDKIDTKIQQFGDSSRFKRMTMISDMSNEAYGDF